MLLLAGILTLSFVSALIFTPAAITAARKLGYLDIPGVRKVHLAPTPLLGGSAVLIAFGLAFLLGLKIITLMEPGILIGYVAGALLIFVIGLIDDGIGMTPGSKLIGQALAAILLLVFGRAGGILMNTPIDFSVAILWMITLMNALNFLDNMDGLCSGISFCASLGYAILGVLSDEPLLVIMGISLMGALMGFMYFNLNPARIFLGDAGSMFLGYTLGAMGIMFAISHPAPHDLLIPLLIMSYPFFDISFVTFTRFREGRSVAQPGKDHTSHRLVELGFRSTRAVWGIFGICLILALLSNLLYLNPYSNWKLIAAAIVALLLLVFGIHLSRRFAHIKEKLLMVAIDLVGINAAFLLYYYLRFQSGWFDVPLVIPIQDFVPAEIWIVFFWLFIFGILGQYEFLWDRHYRVELVKFLKAIVAGIGISALLSIDFSATNLNLIFHLSLYGIILFLCIGVLRLIVLFALGYYYSHGYGKRRTLIIGSPDSMQWFENLCTEKPEWPYDIMARTYINQSGNSVSAGNEELIDLIRHSRVSDVIILEPGKDASTIIDICEVGNQIDVHLKILPQLRSYVRGMKVEGLRNSPLLKIYPERMRAWEWGVKRLIDILASTAILILSLPLTATLVILIKLKFGGSVLTKNSIVGLGQQKLVVYTFRAHAEKIGDEPFALNARPQSAFEKFLRITGIEKLPMLLPVLRGKMAIIGPAPDAYPGSDGPAATNPLYNRRWDVKPGLLNMAGIAGIVSGRGGDSSARLEYDLRYLENMSTLTDTRIFISGIFRLWTRILFLRS